MSRSRYVGAMQPTAPRVCSREPGLLFEGPRWHGAAGELLWVDILRSTLHRGRPGGGEMLEEREPIVLDRHLGCVAPAVGGGYVAGAGAGFLRIGDDGSVRELAQPAAAGNLRMNDGACDPQGRFWAGTQAYDETPGAASLYRLERDGTCTTMLEGLTISNGIGWSPDGATMYLSDSGPGEVDAFDFDGATGSISGRRPFMRADGDGAVADGLTVDAAGDVWMAMHGGGEVRRYSPSGVLEQVIPIPAEQPSSCAFGGDGLDILFVTSARQGLDEAALAQQPASGHVLRVDGLGARGMPAFAYLGDAG